MFQYVLDFLRHNQVFFSLQFTEYDLLLEEAKYFKIKPY